MNETQYKDEGQYSSNIIRMLDSSKENDKKKILIMTTKRKVMKLELKFIELSNIVESSKILNQKLKSHMNQFFLKIQKINANNFENLEKNHIRKVSSLQSILDKNINEEIKFKRKSLSSRKNSRKTSDTLNFLNDNILFTEGK